jgi:hypothetical protein
MPNGKEMKLAKASITLGALFLVLSLVNIARLYDLRSDIWWTPEEMAMPLTQVSNKLVVTVGGQAIDELAKSSQLAVLGTSGPITVNPSEIKVRLNNYDSVLAARIPVLGVFAAGAGAGLAALVIGVVLLLSSAGRREA